jgi:hypothetical protein
MNAAIALGHRQSADESPEQRCVSIEITINARGEKQRLRALVDCGAEDDFISQTVVVKHGLKGIPLKVFGKAVDGRQLTIYGCHNLDVHATDD